MPHHELLCCFSQCADPPLANARLLIPERYLDVRKRRRAFGATFLKYPPPLVFHIFKIIRKANNSSAKDQVFSKSVLTIGAGQEVSCSTEQRNIYCPKRMKSSPLGHAWRSEARRTSLSSAFSAAFWSKSPALLRFRTSALNRLLRSASVIGFFAFGIRPSQKLFGRSGACRRYQKGCDQRELRHCSRSLHGANNGTQTRQGSGASASRHSADRRRACRA